MKTMLRATTIALVTAAAPLAHAAVDCTKDYNAISGGKDMIDLTVSAEVKDNLTGWDADGDGMVSRAEYNEVCQNRPEDYKSIENMSYFKKKQYRGN